MFGTLSSGFICMAADDTSHALLVTIEEVTYTTSWEGPSQSSAVLHQPSLIAVRQYDKKKRKHSCSPILDSCFYLSSQAVYKQTNKQKKATNTNSRVAQTLLSSSNQDLFWFLFSKLALSRQLNWWERADRFITACFHLSAVQLASFFLLSVIWWENGASWFWNTILCFVFFTVSACQQMWD